LKITEIHPLTGMFDLYANDLSRLIEVENDISRDLLRVGALSFTELNVQRVRVREILTSHGYCGGVNRRSGKAL
jgi:hypothetical protein